MFQDYWFHIISFLNIVDRYTHKSLCTDAQNISTLLGWKKLSDKLFNDPNAIDALIRADWTFFQHQTKCHFRHNILYYSHIQAIFWTPIFRHRSSQTNDSPLFKYNGSWTNVCSLSIPYLVNGGVTKYENDWFHFGNWVRHCNYPKDTKRKLTYNLSTATERSPNVYQIYLTLKHRPNPGVMRFKVKMTLYKNLEVVQIDYKP